MNPVSLVYALTALGFTGGIIMMAVVLMTLADIRSNRDVYEAQMAAVEGVRSRFDAGILEEKLSLYRLIEDGSLSERPNTVDLREIAGEFRDATGRRKISASVDLLELSIDNLGLLRRQCENWRVARESLLHRMPLALDDVGGALRRHAEAVDILEGSRRVELALSIRDYRMKKSAVSPDLSRKIIDEMGTSIGIVSLRRDIADLSMLTEHLRSAESLEVLADIKDNEFMTVLARLRRQLPEDFTALGQGEVNRPGRLLEVFEESLFGKGYQADFRHQTLVPGIGGLFDLRVQWLTLEGEKSRLYSEITMGFDRAGRILKKIDHELDLYLHDEGVVAEAALSRAWKIMLSVWFFTAIFFAAAAIRIILAIKRQIRAVERANIELAAQRTELAAANDKLKKEIEERLKAQEEKEKIAERLRNMQKMESVGTLAGGVAHNFNNILTSVLGFADMALDDIDEASPARGNVEHVIQAANRARQQVEQIVAFSRGMEEESRPVDLGRVLTGFLERIAKTLPTGIELVSSIAPDTGLFLGDEEQLQEVLKNLYSNAVYAMEGKGGILEIKHDMTELEGTDLVAAGRMESAPGKFLRFTVRDSGVGMDKMTMERIFEPYFTTKPVDKGSGLGLAVVHGIVRNYGGIIKVDSSVGKGTVVTVLFPLAPEVSSA